LFLLKFDINAQLYCIIVHVLIDIDFGGARSLGMCPQ